MVAKAASEMRLSTNKNSLRTRRQRGTKGSSLRHFRVRAVCARGENAMCEKCVEIDKRIKRYKNIVQLISDKRTADQMKQLIADLEAQKVALHPGTN